jgi:L-iditol 2-dehydrogenase
MPCCAHFVSDEEATLVVTAGKAINGITELGGLIAGKSVVVTGPGPIGLLAIGVVKALGANPVILAGTRNNRLRIGKELRPTTFSTSTNKKSSKV